MPFPPAATDQRDQQVAEQHQIQPNLKNRKLAPKVARIPITDRSAKARAPLQGEEDQRAVIDMGGEIDERVDQAAQREPEQRISPVRRVRAGVPGGGEDR